MSPQNVQIVCRRLLKSDQFCRCLATSTWSFPQRAGGSPRILGAVPSVGNRALATQASETKLRSCVTSNLSQMGKKLSRTSLLLQAKFLLSYFSPKTFWSLSRFKVEAFLFSFLFAAAAAVAVLKTAYSFFNATRPIIQNPFAQRRFRSWQSINNHFF